MRDTLVLNKPLLRCAFLVLVVLLGYWGTALNPAPACAQSPARNLEKDLSQTRDKAQKHRKALKSLTTKERRLYTDLAQTEKRIQKLRERLSQQQKRLETFRKQQRRLSQETEGLQARQQAQEQALQTVLRELWPLHLARKYGGGMQTDSWAEADRHLTWLKTYYDQAEVHLMQLQRRAKAIAAKTEEHEALVQKAQSTVAELTQTRERLVEDRLTYLNRVRSIRSQRLAKEDQLAAIQETIDSLQYRLKSLKSKNFKDQKGYLPWPARGSVVQEFAPAAAQPHRGIGLKVSSSTVKAVSWGKVVHNDQLRGFGHVVILLHQGGYYSLYAFLAQSDVRMGQQVEKGEVIGKPGYYPQADATGMYFELRFGQKAINPGVWLVSR